METFPESAADCGGEVAVFSSPLVVKSGRVEEEVTGTLVNSCGCGCTYPIPLGWGCVVEDGGEEVVHVESHILASGLAWLGKYVVFVACPTALGAVSSSIAAIMSEMDIVSMAGIESCSCSGSLLTVTPSTWW